MTKGQYYLPSRDLVDQDKAAVIEGARVPRSKFTGSWMRTTAFDAGYLVPFLVDEIIPGDHMKYNVTALVRMATPLFPMFTNQNVETFFFFVPNRLVWTNWVRFMGEQDNPTDTIAYSVPYVESQANGFDVNSLWDHLGAPVVGGGVTAGQKVQMRNLVGRMYNLIYNTWYRDENVQTSVLVPTGNGPDTYTDFVLMRRGKRHDYFTSALPWPQKFTAPTVPIAGLAPVMGIGIDVAIAGGGPHNFYDTTQTLRSYAQSAQWNSAGESPAGANFAIEQQLVGGNYYPKVYADLSATSGIPINTLRQAWMVQSLLERDARGGTRYVELIWNHFGVRNPDFRLQRPEYIGGGTSPLNVTPVANTSNTNLGALGAAATSAGQHQASYAATEHGFVLGLVNIRTEQDYQQGLHRMYLRNTRYDYYFPSTASLGEQAITNAEIYYTGVANDDNTVFGYQERWAELRMRYNEITGKMRSGVTGTLDAWHLGIRYTGGAPTLSNAFMIDNPPMTRILAAGSGADNQQYLANILIHREAVRPIPTYGTPATLGRF